jgi:hypothetical protein
MTENGVAAASRRETMNRRQKLTLVGLLSVVALLLTALLVGYRMEDAFAEGDGPAQGPPPLLAATGACGIGAEVGVLYLVDSEKKQLAVYSAFQGRDLRFVAARKIYYDLELLEANDKTQKQFSVRSLKKAFDAFQKKKGGGEEKKPRRR